MKVCDAANKNSRGLFLACSREIRNPQSASGTASGCVRSIDMLLAIMSKDNCTDVLDRFSLRLDSSVMRV